MLDFYLYTGLFHSSYIWTQAIAAYRDSSVKSRVWQEQNNKKPGDQIDIDRRKWMRTLGGPWYFHALVAILGYPASSDGGDHGMIFSPRVPMSRGFEFLRVDGRSHSSRVNSKRMHTAS